MTANPTTTKMLLSKGLLYAGCGSSTGVLRVERLLVSVTSLVGCRLALVCAAGIRPLLRGGILP